MYIASFQTGVRDLLCTLFRKELPQCNIDNIPDLLSDLFIEIIADAVTNKKSTRRGAKNHQNHLTEFFSDVSRELFPGKIKSLPSTPAIARGVYFKKIEKQSSSVVKLIFLQTNF